MEPTLRSSLIKKLEIAKYIVLVLMFINMIFVLANPKPVIFMLTTGILLGFMVGIFWVRCELGWDKK